MPRSNRCVLSGLAYHITQRGVDQRETFCSDADRSTYLRLLRLNREEAGVRLRRIHGRYTQYHNAQTERSGHLWQSRYFSCPLGPTHLWRALIYVERNPVMAGLMYRAEDYRWSSAAAHASGRDQGGLLDMDWWAREGPGGDWAEMLRGSEHESRAEIRRCTYSGRPYGDESFVQAIGERFGRHWQRGRPKKQSPAVSSGEQACLW